MRRYTEKRFNGQDGRSLWRAGEPQLSGITSRGRATGGLVRRRAVWYDEGGVKREDCDYIPITTIGKQAERDAKYLGQGSPVAVEGRIQSWYQPAEKRGGFNFKALRVQYLGRPGALHSETASQGSNEADEWVRYYEKAGGVQGAAFHAN